MTIQTLPLLFYSIFLCFLKHSVILDLLMSPGKGTFDLGWSQSLLLLYWRTGSWIFRSNRGRIIRFAAFKRFIVTVKCSTCYSLASVIFSENPTHNTFKWKKYYDFSHGKDIKKFVQLWFFFFLVSYTEFVFLKKIFSEKKVTNTNIAVLRIYHVFYALLKVYTHCGLCFQ